MSKIEAGQWVEIRRVVLPPGQRAPQVPPETQAVPLEMRVRGFLTAAAEIGQEVWIETLTGRRVNGILVDPQPAYNHTFGPMPAALAGVGRELKAMLAEKGGNR